MTDIHFSPDWGALVTSSVPVLRVVQRVDESIPVVISDDDPVSRKVLITVVEGAGIPQPESRVALRARVPALKNTTPGKTLKFEMPL